MSQERFWILLSKKLSGEASAEELQHLENLIIEHPEWQYAVQNLGDLWKQELPHDEMQAEDAYMMNLHRMNELNIPFDGSFVENIPSISPKRHKRWIWTAAAAVILLAGLWGFKAISNTKSHSNLAEKEVNEISTRQGSKSKIQLPDGSIVWLNAGSKLTYTKEYGQQLREVNLQGEGFFDVVKNKEKPFIIHTNDINIKVLGTAFNVKAYPEDKKTETSLIRGSIEVTIKNRPNDKIILAPSEKLVVENGEATMPVQSSGTITATKAEAAKAVTPLISINKLVYNPEDGTVAETEWVNNKLVFRNESFSDLATRLERWYDVSIEIADDEIANERLNGIFETENIQQALDALKESIAFKYEKKGNNIIIHR